MKHITKMHHILTDKIFVPVDTYNIKIHLYFEQRFELKENMR